MSDGTRTVPGHRTTSLMVRRYLPSLEGSDGTGAPQVLAQVLSLYIFSTRRFCRFCPSGIYAPPTRAPAASRVGATCAWGASLGLDRTRVSGAQANIYASMTACHPPRRRDPRNPGSNQATTVQPRENRAISLGTKNATNTAQDTSIVLNVAERVVGSGLIYVISGCVIRRSTRTEVNAPAAGRLNADSWPSITSLAMGHHTARRSTPVGPLPCIAG